MRRIMFPLGAIAVGAMMAMPAMANTLPKRIKVTAKAQVRTTAQTPLKPDRIGTMRTGVSAKALNPQPLPPGPDKGAAAMRTSASAKALNPQPLPPGPNKGAAAMRAGASAKALNPQPLPPGPDKGAAAMRTGASAKALNPQPLPPGPDKAKLNSAKIQQSVQQLSRQKLR